MALLLFMCGLFWGPHKFLAPRARTLLGGLGQATLSFFAIATLLFVFFCECPKFCDLAKQRRKIFGGVSEVEKTIFPFFFSGGASFSWYIFFFCCDHATRWQRATTSNYCPPSLCPSCLAQYSADWMYGTGLLPVRRDFLPLATRKFYRVFSTVFLMCLSCCFLLV